MKARFLPLALIAAVLLAFGAVAAACGDDGGETLTIEEYFARLAEIDDETEEEEAALDAQLEEELAGITDEEEALEVIQDIFPAQLDNFADFVDDLADLDPPDDIRDDHDDTVDAMRDFVAVFRELVDELDEVESIGEMDALFEGEDFAQAEQRATEACLRVEQLAADNGITVDFNCEDE